MQGSGPQEVLNLWTRVPVTLFVFQIRTRAISAKGMTLVSPLQLLLFACKKISSNGEIVELDDW